MQPIIEAEYFTLTPTVAPTADPTPTQKPPSNITYSLDKATGTLTISGTGDMEDYEEDSSPFYDNGSIKSVIIENGVTSIGDWAFSYCDGLMDVYYSGSEEEWNEVYIGGSNDCLKNANIVFNYVRE